jgi:hypothetical protein
VPGTAVSIRPGGGRWLGDVIGQLARHAALMLFCITAYALAPVAGFGWLIATMRLAQRRWDQRALRAAYITVFLLILAYAEVPWTGVLLDWTLR